MNETSEGVPVTVKWETARINAWHIGTAVVALVINAFAFGGIYVTMKQNDATAVASIAALQARVAVVEQKIPQFEVIGMQIQQLTTIAGQNTKGIDEANKRMDRIVESQSGKLDVIIRNIADLTTEVRVIQAQTKDRETQRTRFPIVRP